MQLISSAVSSAVSSVKLSRMRTISRCIGNGGTGISFSGIDKNMSGNVKFILKVQEISNDK